MAKDGRTWRRRLLWAGLAGLIVAPLGALFVLAATDPSENIALSRNAVVTVNGEKLWKGTFWNHSDSLYTDLDAVVLLLDKDGKPVGQARGAARRLDPGEVFHLETPMPPDAVRMQIYQLRWTSGRHHAVLGPYKAHPFGDVMDRECGDVRLALGSCSPQREQD